MSKIKLILVRLVQELPSFNRVTAYFKGAQFVTKKNRIHIISLLVVSLLTSPTLAQNVGVAACDDILQKYEMCMAKMPRERQQEMKDSIAQMRSSWRAIARQGDTPRKELASDCRSQADTLNQSLAAHGCRF